MGEKRKTRVFGLERDQLGRLLSAGMEDDEQVDGARLAAFLESTLEHVGQWIGPYRLVRVLGEGGMGIVYLAEQERPIKRQVALKVIKPGMDSKRVVARFEVERQTLALLDHPNIAHVHDAGTTDSGRPYFVMEYVEGVPITEHCDREKLDMEVRLALFQQVCHAVQHAHQKGIIHRDLKPSNILVATQDGQAIPKIIDFGVAKAIAQPLTDKTLATEHGQLFGTPEYMSPEQADPGNEDIDTRADVYSLGVLLYVLLTGVLPFDTAEWREGGLDQVRRTIRETDPKTPSTRLTKLGAEAQNVAERRGTDVATLTRRLRRELEWIPLKAMRKERRERYRSASELADDIDNYLGAAPLRAGPPGATYRLKKFLHRHRSFVAAITAASLVLLSSVVVSTGLYLHAERERANAQAIADFMTNEILNGLSEYCWGNVTLNEALEQAAQSLDTQLTDQPLVEASIRWELGTMCWGKPGDYRMAMEQTERANQISLRERGREYSPNSTALRYNRMGRYEEAEVLFNAQFPTGRPLQADGAIWPDVFPFAYWNLAMVYVNQGRYEEAVHLLEQALALAAWDPENKWRLYYSSILAGAYREQGRYDAAESLYGNVLEGQYRTLGVEHLNVASSRAGLARVHMYRGDYDRAEPLLLKALDVTERAWGRQHPKTLSYLNQLAILRAGQGRHEEALVLFREALEGRKERLGDDHPRTLESLNDFGAFLRQRERHDEAESLLLEAFRGRTAKLGAEHPHTVESLHQLVSLYEAWNKPEQAVEYRAKLPLQENPAERN